MTRGEIETEIDELFGEGQGHPGHRGLAKVLEDRAEFEVVADISPERSGRRSSRRRPTIASRLLTGRRAPASARSSAATRSCEEVARELKPRARRRRRLRSSPTSATRTAC